MLLQSNFMEKVNSFEKDNVKFGYITVQPGERVPLNGLSEHSGDEYSIILDGELVGESDNKAFHVKKGDFTYFPKGEPHWCENKSEHEVKILYVLVE